MVTSVGSGQPSTPAYRLHPPSIPAANAAFDGPFGPLDRVFLSSEAMAGEPGSKVSGSQPESLIGDLESTGDTISKGVSSFFNSGAHGVESSLFPDGKINFPAPSLPPYPTLNAAQKAQALKRGGGTTVPEPVIQDPGGGHHEPVTMVAIGSLSKLTKDLKSQGWGPPTLFPMSTMEVNGQKAVLSLQKNAQLGGLSRDHLRIFNLGNNKNGQPMWGIAASRDLSPFLRVSPQFNAGHNVDPHVDGERDLVMNDMLKADPTAAKTWQINPGQLSSADKGYQSDGMVYSFSV